MTDTKSLVDETGKHSVDPKHAPVSLPPAGFEMGALATALDKAIEAKPEKRDEAIQAALVKGTGLPADEAAAVLAPRDSALVPGYKHVEVENDDGMVSTTMVIDAKNPPVEVDQGLGSTSEGVTSATSAPKGSK